ncbi:MAG TPA: PKD domain-containing protein [Gemmatimonadales bacterium]|nr:PKD domain-containing protein [Gemmatimonadales bacterium]
MRSRAAHLGRAARALALLLLTTCQENVSPPPPPPAPTPASSPTIPVARPISADAASPSAALLIGAGDIARCDRTNDEATAALLDANPTATVFTVGDNINGNASLTDYTSCFGPSWGRAKTRMRPSVGEMDYKTAAASGFFRYFGTAGGDSAKYYYSYTVGAWHVIALNDNIAMTPTSPQVQWLVSDLAQNAGKCILAYWHHPRFSSTGTNNLASVKPFWDTLYAHGADIVINAHYDNYERFAPQSPTGAADPAKGIREFIVGTGGQNIQNPGGAKPNSVIRGTSYGVLKLSLDVDTYSWQFVPIAGQTFSDTGSAACHSRIPVSSVDVTPATAGILVGGTVQLTATPKDAAGNPLSGRVVTWTSGDTSIAIVSNTGLVTGKKAGGPVTITATSEGKSGAAAVSVTTVPVASVDVSPSSATIQTYATLQLTAQAKDANGNPISGASFTWASSAPGIANVSASGSVVGVSAGTANITATSQGQTGTSVITVQGSSGPAVLAGAGDIADCSRASQEGTARVLDGIVGQVATFGDGAYPDGSLSDYMNCFDPSWGRHKARTRPATGNHEYNHGVAAGAPGYFAYWGAAAGDSGVGYYSYQLGAWHIIVINSSLDMSAGSPQEQWLRADLAAHPTTCTLAYWHHPRFSSGGNGSTIETQPIWQALYDYGADVVINGHDHDYERFAPQTPTGVLDTQRGIREFVVGTGGNSLYSWPGNPIANSEVRSNVSYGVIKMTLWPTSYDWQFMPVTGGTFTDQGSALCVSSTPLPNQAPVANPGGPYNSQGSVTLDGTASRDPDNNNPLSYAWDLGDGTTATTPTVTHTYPPGTYTVTLTVTDAKGAASTPASTSVTIGNMPPVVNAGPDQSVVGGTAMNLRVTFSDPGATDNPWAYTITWGDGASDAGSSDTQSPITGSHIFATPGQYTTHVTVTDKFGASGSAQFLVKVLDPSSVIVFSGSGNIASCGTDEDEATAEIIDTLPGSVFVLGDNVNPSGSAANYTNCYNPTWGRAKARTHPVIGNHEYDVAGASGYFGYFGAAAGDTGKGYYSFDLGNYWHVIVLNNTASVNSGSGSVQEQWLKADLAANTKPCTIAMFHYPLFFSSDDPSWLSASGVLPIWNDLYAARAEIVLNGQQYDYERFAPQDPGANPDAARGIREFNVGVGGYASSMPTAIAPNTEAVSDALGVLKLTLGPDSYIWDFIPAPGFGFSDHGSGNCH